MKYLLSLLIIGSMFLAPVVQAETVLQGNASFTDIEMNHPYFTDIDFLRSRGISQGDERGLFNPERGLSRCELLKVSLLSRGVTLPTSSTAAFSDLSIEDWCNSYAFYAKAQGIVNGYPDGTFHGNSFVTEIEALKILLNALQVTLPTPTADLYKNAKIGEWWTPYLQYVKDMNIEVMPTTVKYPLQDTFLRQKMARVLYRVMTLKEQGMTIWSDTPGRSTTEIIQYSDSKFTVMYDTAKWTKFDFDTGVGFQMSTESKITLTTPAFGCTDLATCFTAWEANRTSGDTPVLGVGTFRGYQTVERTSVTLLTTSQTTKHVLFFQNNTFFIIEYSAPTDSFDSFMVEAQKLTDTFTLK